MRRTLTMGMTGLVLLASAGAALACPYGKSAQTSDQQTTASGTVLLPTTTGTTTETKTGG